MQENSQGNILEHNVCMCFADRWIDCMILLSRSKAMCPMGNVVQGRESLIRTPPREYQKIAPMASLMPMLNNLGIFLKGKKKKNRNIGGRDSRETRTNGNTSGDSQSYIWT